jgi:predicted outer membrane lipoprotein
MSAAVEVAFMVSGVLAIAWAILNPEANFFLRLLAIAFGVIALMTVKTSAGQRQEERQ